MIDIARHAVAIDPEGIEPCALVPGRRAILHDPGIEWLVDEAAPAQKLHIGQAFELLEMAEDRFELVFINDAQLVLPAGIAIADDMGQPVRQPIVPGKAIAPHGHMKPRGKRDDIVAFPPDVIARTQEIGMQVAKFETARNREKLRLLRYDGMDDSAIVKSGLLERDAPSDTIRNLAKWQTKWQGDFAVTCI